jgi:hypothetical protein
MKKDVSAPESGWQVWQIRLGTLLAISGSLGGREQSTKGSGHIWL